MHIHNKHRNMNIGTITLVSFLQNLQNVH